MPRVTSSLKLTHPGLLVFLGTAALLGVAWRPDIAILVLISAGVVVGGVLLSRRTSAIEDAKASGYILPVKWEHWEREPTSKDGRARRNLASAALLDERSRMPRCLVWYRPAELDETKGLPEGQWVSVMDGNESLPAVSPMPQYVQVYDKLPGGARRLFLMSVSPDVLANLNRGPLRKVRIDMTVFPSGKSYQINLPMGAAGAPMPLEPRTPGGTHGTSGIGDGSIDAEPA